MAGYKINSPHGIAILGATILASGMAFLDGSVVTIAIPTIQTQLNATFTQIQWIVNGYALFLSSLILISGSLGDKFGRKRIFLYGIGLFTVSSFLCGLSRSVTPLMLLRCVQGIGAAMMVPGSLSIIDRSFAPNIRGSAIGIWSGFSAGLAALGPFVGGFLVQTFGWPAIFFINIPLGILALLLTLKFIPESKNELMKQLDYIGALLVFIALFGFAFALINGPAFGWNNITVIGGLLVGVIGVIAFVIEEKKVTEPIVPFAIFKKPLVVGANLVTLFLYFALSGVIFFLALNLLQIQHYSQIFAGLGLTPAIILIALLSGPGGMIADRFGPRVPMIIGPMLVAIGMASFILPTNHTNYFTSFLPGLILFGLGMSLVIAPLTKSALSVDPNYSGTASGINNAVSRIAGLLAVVMLGAVVLTTFGTRLEHVLGASSLSQPQKEQILNQKDKLGAITIPVGFSGSQQQQTQNIIDESFVYGFRWAIGIAAFLAFLSAIVSFFTIHEPKNEGSNGFLTKH